jgi:gliding motility-associated-like protein
VIITVTPVNDPPEVTSDTVYEIMYFNDTLSVCLNYFDSDGDSVDISSLILSASNGVIQGLYSGDSCFEYIPDVNYIGGDTLSLTICDNGSPVMCDTVTVIIQILPRYPIAINDNYSIQGDTMLTVLSNDTNFGNDVTLSILDSTLNGILEISGNQVIYRPDIDFCGIDQFTYSICNILGFCDSALVILDVTPVDSDGDGIPDYIETRTLDTDGDGTPNYLSLDSDGDGLTDLIEASNYLIDPCNVVLNDCDNDGIADYIDSLNCNQELEIPQGFSPNGDGVNEVFIIEGIENYPNNNVRIFNRWGNRVFEASPYKNEWSGTAEIGLVLGETDLPEGTYFYIIELEENASQITGYVYLKR